MDVASQPPGATGVSATKDSSWTSVGSALVRDEPLGWHREAVAALLHDWIGFLWLLEQIAPNFVALKQHRFIILYFYRLEVRHSSYQAKIKVSAGLCSLWSLLERIMSLPFPASRGCLFPWLKGCFLHLKASSVASSNF